MDELSLKRNFSYAFAAQGVALAVGCLTNLILPRVLGAEDFSWWQLFTFYATYIPCLALGLNDGVYLRYGGRDKSQLDPAALRSQFWVGAGLPAGAGGGGWGRSLGWAVAQPQRRAVLLGALVYFWPLLLPQPPGLSVPGPGGDRRLFPVPDLEQGGLSGGPVPAAGGGGPPGSLT